MAQDTEGADVVQLIVDDRIATVSFNRPAVLNAISTRTLERLIDVFDTINESPSVRCVILKGNGRCFCVGADQKERPAMSLDDLRRRRRLSPRAFGAMRDCVHPVVAQVHGYALGGGLEMALSCDLIVAAEDTVMGLIETTRASIPAGGGTQLLPRLVGIARAKELIFTGRRFTANMACEWGLVNYAVPAEQLETTTKELVEEITAAAPISCTQAKIAINASTEVGVRMGVGFEAALYERILSADDRIEALEAYAQGRRPEFKGR